MLQSENSALLKHFGFLSCLMFLLVWSVQQILECMVVCSVCVYEGQYLYLHSKYKLINMKVQSAVIYHQSWAMPGYTLCYIIIYYINSIRKGHHYTILLCIIYRVNLFRPSYNVMIKRTSRLISFLSSNMFDASNVSCTNYHQEKFTQEVNLDYYK